MVYDCRVDRPNLPLVFLSTFVFAYSVVSVLWILFFLFNIFDYYIVNTKILKKKTYWYVIFTANRYLFIFIYPFYYFVFFVTYRGFYYTLECLEFNHNYNNILWTQVSRFNGKVDGTMILLSVCRTSHSFSNIVH